MRANDNIDYINFNSNLGVSNIRCGDYKRDLDVSGKDYRLRSEVQDDTKLTRSLNFDTRWGLEMASFESFIR